MRVKRLEIQGFKSFKDKTVIHFDHTITGIVGPNGCGKSNIVDAFFWVMGEQSYKHMRGSGSEDLIFNGSTKYTSLGMAEATLVLETDADVSHGAADRPDLPIHLRVREVSVTRRVFRDGQGEYFINGIQARLRDIQEFFMDTGVGAKGYSVVEQGQIGKVVNAKPEERRLLIEEAAGIAKYKKRKLESQRKMEATETNLSRLNDIVQEIERTLGSLERQAQKARLYRKYKDELLDQEMTWGRRRKKVIENRLERARSKREAAEQELAGLRAELQAAENRLEADRAGQLTDTQLAEELQTSVQGLSEELTRAQSSLDLSRRRQGDLSGQLDVNEAESRELRSAIAIERERVSAREAEAASADSTHLEAAEAGRVSEDRARSLRESADGARRELEEARRGLLADASRASELSSRSAALGARIDASVSMLERLMRQIHETESQVGFARLEEGRVRAEAGSAGVRKASLAAENRSQAERLQELEKGMRESSRRQEQAVSILTQARSRLQSLEELSAACEGFTNGPKSLLDRAQASGRRDRLSALAHAIEVQAGFEAAVEGYLESRLEMFVTDDAGFALESLTALRDEKQGRATILVRGRAEAQDQGDFGGQGFEVLGFLKDRVKIKDPALSGIFSRAVLVRDLAPLGQLGNDRAPCFPDWDLVTPAGEVFERTGVLRGGSLQCDSPASVLGRGRAIEELKASVATAEMEVAEAEKLSATSQSDLDLAGARQAALRTEAQGVEVRVAELARDLMQADRSLRELEDRLATARGEAEILSKGGEAARRDREQVAGALAEIDSRQELVEASIGTLEAGLSGREVEARAAEERYGIARVAAASLGERRHTVHRELDASRSLLLDREKRLAEVERALERARREREEHTGSDVGLESRIAELMAAVSTEKRRLSGVKDRLEQANVGLNGSLEKIKSLHSTGDQRTTEANQLALETEKLTGELAHLIQNLEEKYGPGCLDRPSATPEQQEMADPVVTAEMSAEEEKLLSEEVERLRERIRRLGEVNVMAVEEYDETKKRRDFLVGERSDLLRSMENLREAIEHINKTSEERFRRAFDAIASRFERLFPIIFGGGQAQLSLVYPEGSNDILEAGIDILAQPPGKKIVNIGVLSGGEKALTAVSLIFAIFLVKPSPFCVLDEVDAPLDDANIGRFNALLKEMSVKSQFILITHNKKTMELNDTLYGVTMEEPGVSKMVSIELH